MAIEILKEARPATTRGNVKRTEFITALNQLGVNDDTCFEFDKSAYSTYLAAKKELPRLADGTPPEFVTIVKGEKRKVWRTK